MIGLLTKELLRQRGLVGGLAVLLFAGLLSLYLGKAFLEKQQDILELTEHAQAEQLQRHLEYGHGDLGLFLYYVKFGFAGEVSPLAGLSIGRQDMRQAAQLVNIRNLEEQKHAHELVNPYFQLLGNFDFSFVLIYLFPLIIIALTFNLWSEERESGRWPLLAVQSHRPYRLLGQKLLLRLAIVLAVLITLLGAAVPYLGLSLDAAFFTVSGISVGYLVFWFALAWFVISHGKSSSHNALTLLTTWLLLTTVLPAAVNSAVSTIYPIPEAYETTIDSRDGYHTKWDQPKEAAINPFKQLYPEYAAYDHPEDASFSWFWYYAMQHMGDVEAAEARAAMKEKLRKRNNVTRAVGYLLPSVHTQLSLNSLAKTDLTNYLAYLNALEAHHEDLRQAFYQDIFDDVPAEGIDWEDYGMGNFSDRREVNPSLILPLVLISLVLFLLSHFAFKRTAARLAG
ncbi:DUF3526 domain-containing protein [Lewinella sp. 4G2]|uniref:DUF3526 domain-containing protein n=1 Tax=Lewinella sp. 4G2 TaxID=1803372 RepID=UPI0007B4BB15|nr:DUF3526 domain-containing protein [Lewinella sp. 4G2]OAV45681.1 hypothetical protein A3850_014800 [Lewinella sp. 4G2]